MKKTAFKMRSPHITWESDSLASVALIMTRRPELNLVNETAYTDAIGRELNNYIFGVLYG